MTTRIVFSVVDLDCNKDWSVTLEVRKVRFNSRVHKVFGILQFREHGLQSVALLSEVRP